MTEVGSIVGTAQYLSPEQARGLDVGPQSDLYSMGIVLYEMLTGELPFTGDSAVEIAMKQVVRPAALDPKAEPARVGGARAGRDASRSPRIRRSGTARPARWRRSFAE